MRHDMNTGWLASQPLVRLPLRCGRTMATS